MRLPALILLLSFLLPISARAHEVSAVAAKALLNSDGTWGLEMSLDVASSDSAEMDDQISPEEAAINYLRNGITVLFDDNEAETTFSDPIEVEVEGGLPSQNELTRMYTETSGCIPEGAKAFRVHVAPDIEVGLIMVIFIDGRMTRRSQAIYSGEYGRPIDLSFVNQKVIEADPFVVEEEENFAVMHPFFLGVALPFQPVPVVAVLVAILVLGAGSTKHSLQNVGIFLGCLIVGTLGQVSFGSLNTIWLGTLPLLVICALVLIPRIPYGAILGVSAVSGVCAGMAINPGGAEPGTWLGLLTVLILLAGVVWVVASSNWKSEKPIHRAPTILAAGAALWWTIQPLIVS